MITRNKFESFADEYLIDVIKNSPCLEAFFRTLNLSASPNNRRKFKNFVNLHKLNISHFDKSWSQKKNRKHTNENKICPQCGKEFLSKVTKRGIQKTCSRKCSNIFFFNLRMTEETKKKISESVKLFLNLNPKICEQNRTRIKKYNREIKKWEPIEPRVCPICQTNFKTKKRSQKFCSRKCCGTFHSRRIKKLIEEGKHKGWTKRPIASYAEKYFQFKLNELNIEYKFNFAIPKSSLGLKCASCYFLDFYFSDIKLDLEIDGKQHKIPARKLSDEKRDRLLSENGIIVFRIEWKNPSKKENKDYLDKKFAEFLEIHKNLLDKCQKGDILEI